MEMQMIFLHTQNGNRKKLFQYFSSVEILLWMKRSGREKKMLTNDFYANDYSLIYR